MSVARGDWYLKSQKFRVKTIVSYFLPKLSMLCRHILILEMKRRSLCELSLRAGHGEGKEHVALTLVYFFDASRSDRTCWISLRRCTARSISNWARDSWCSYCEASMYSSTLLLSAENEHVIKGQKWFFFFRKRQHQHVKLRKQVSKINNLIVLKIVILVWKVFGVRAVSLLSKGYSYVPEALQDLAVKKAQI